MTSAPAPPLAPADMDLSRIVRHFSPAWFAAVMGTAAVPLAVSFLDGAWVRPTAASFVVLAVVMFTSQIEVAWSNFQDHSVIWVQPTISVTNSTVWCLYALTRADRFLLLANLVGILFAVITILAIFL